MDASFRLYILSSNGPEVYAVNIYKDEDNKDRYVILGNTNVSLHLLEVLHLRDYVCSIKRVGDSDKNNLKLWKVIGVKSKDIKEQNISTEEDIVQKLSGKEMELEESFSTYFQDELDNKNKSGSSIIIIIPTTAGLGITQGPNWNDASSIYEWIQQFTLHRGRNRLVKTFGDNFMFCGRNVTINTLWNGNLLKNGIVGRFNNRDKDDKGNHPIPVLAGGPGTGKSRFLDEIERILNQCAMDSNNKEIHDAFTNMIVINTTYGNGSPADEVDTNVGAQASLSMRILFEHFRPRHEYGKFDFPGFRSRCNCYPKVSDFTLSTALEVIYTDFMKIKKLTTSNPLLVLALGIDEINKLYENNLDRFKSLINSIGGLMCKTPMRIFFIPILAGTIEGPLERYITYSMHQPLPLPLNLLNEKDSIEIGKNLKLFDDDYAICHHYFRISINDIGGHPRTLESFYQKFSEDLEQYEGDPYRVKIEDVIINVKCDIESKYRLSLNSKWLDEPLIKAILELPVDKYEKIKIDNEEISYQDLSSMGVLNMEEKTTGCYIRLPYLWASVLVKKSKHPGMVYWKSMFDYDDPMDWESFEDFNVKFWALRLSLFRLLGYQKIDLKKLLKGAKFSRGFPEEVYVTLPDNVKLCKLRHRYPATENNNNKNMDEMEVSWRCYTNLDCLTNGDVKNEKYMNHVFLNAPGAPFDAFGFLKYINDESSETGTFLIAQQIKYPNIESLNPMIIDQHLFDGEYKKVSEATEDVPVDDLVLLFLTNAESKESMNIKCKNNSALVSRKQFRDFYGFTYASRAQFASANEKIFINSAPPETLKIFGFTENQRHDISLKRPFSSLDDIKAKLGISENKLKKLKHDNRIIF